MIKGGITELDPHESKKAINTTCFGTVLVAQEAVKRILKRKSGVWQNSKLMKIDTLSKLL